MFLRLVAALVLTAGLTTACSHDPGPPADITYYSTPIGGKAGKAGKADASKKAKAGKDARSRRKSVVAENAGIRFKAPAGWRVLSDGSVRFTSSDPRAQAVAKEIGMSTEELQAMYARVDVFVSGFGGILTAGPYAAGRMPSESDFTADLRGAGELTAPAEDVRTPIGTGRTFAYRISVGSTTFHGVSLYVPNGSTVVEISSGSASPSAARDALDQVIPTLSRR